MHRMMRFQFQAQLEQLAIALPRGVALHRAAQLHELRLGQPGHRPQGAAVHLPDPLQLYLNAVPGRNDPQRVLDLPDVQTLRHEQVGHEELGRLDHGRVELRLLIPGAPQPARDVGLDAGAVALAAHLTAAVGHVGQLFQRPRHVAVGGLPGLPNFA